MSPARLLICGFGAFPAAPRNPAGAAVQALAAKGWRPAGAEVDYLVVPVVWNTAIETIEARLAQARADGVLIVGVAVTARAFRVERLARNRASTTTLDHDGDACGSVAILAQGPLELAATAPIEAIHRAIEVSELPVEFSSDAGDYLCNFTFYRLLLGERAHQVAFLHTPQARECADGGVVSLADVETAVRAAAQAFAANLRTPAA